MKEIVSKQPALKKCLTDLANKQSVLNSILSENEAKAREEISKNLYDKSHLDEEYDKAIDITPEEKESLVDVKRNVEKMLSSEDWKQINNTWKKYGP